jgi:hypothetical protein
MERPYQMKIHVQVKAHLNEGFTIQCRLYLSGEKKNPTILF